MLICIPLSGWNKDDDVQEKRDGRFIRNSPVREMRSSVVSADLRVVGFSGLRDLSHVIGG